jgi:hypothetical protein
MGKGPWSLIGWTWSWRSSLLSLASVAIVGASPLSAKRPLAGSYLRCPAPAFHGGNTSRLLAQPALQAKPVFLSSSRGDSWDASRQIAQPVACPISHPHDTRHLRLAASPYPGECGDDSLCLRRFLRRLRRHRGLCRWISCRKNTGYHAMDPKIQTQGAERVRSRIATKHGDGSLELSNALRTAERDAKLYPGLGPLW